MVAILTTQKWKLLEPIKVGTMSLRNRMVMAPMLTRLADLDGSVTEKMIDYYAERAKRPLGAIIVEYSYVDKGGQARPHQLGVYSDHLITGLKRLAERIKASGTKAILQIHHTGRQAHREVIGTQPVGPSPVMFFGETPRELTLTEIEQLQNSFAEAARRAKEAGFDGIEIHGAHGYLISQFLSPYTNKRTDKYGGALESRSLFALETVEKVRKKAGNPLTVGFRMNGEDYVPGGITLDEATRFAGMLQDAGVDYLHVSGGMQDVIQYIVQPAYVEEACFVHFAERVKKAVRVPVITVGSLNVETGEKALREGKADLVAFGRSLLADPQLPDKVIGGRIEDIVPCIRGNKCVFNPGRNNRPTIACEVNPAVAREAEFRIIPAKTRKAVLVVGGGIAGMEAARIAALRGHDVTLIERTERLGGHLLEASVPSFKNGIKRLVNWGINQVSKGGIRIELGTEVTPALVKKRKPDVLVVAVGSNYKVSAVHGSGKPFVITTYDVLLGKKAIGERVVVLGGGLIGCETALYVAEQHKKSVSIIEMLDEILIEEGASCKQALTERLERAGVETYMGWHAEKITDIGVICTGQQGQRREWEADTVVQAIGLVKRGKEAENFTGLAPEVYNIGDCVEARNIFCAFEDAWNAILKT